MEAVGTMRKAFNSMKSEEAVERILDMFSKTKTNADFCEYVSRKMYY